MDGSSKQRVKWLLLIVALASAAAVWFFYPRPSDRVQIETLLRRGEHGIETKNTSEILECIAPDYHDSENITRTDLQRMVMQWPRVSERGELTIEQLQLEVTRDTATGWLEVQFDLIGQGHRTSLPMHLTMTFGKYRRGIGRVWLIKSVEGYSMGTMMEGVGE